MLPTSLVSCGKSLQLWVHKIRLAGWLAGWLQKPKGAHHFCFFEISLTELQMEKKEC
jgi:hypothetical protein